MFKLTTHHLSPDGRSADSALGDQPRGEVDAAALTGLLGNFRQLDPAQNHTHDPHLDVQGPGGRFIIRLNHGKLYAYNPRDTSQPAIELEVPALIDLVTGSSQARPVAADDAPQWTAEDERLARKATRRGLVLLTVGLVLNAAAVYLFLQSEPNDPPVAYEPVTDGGTIETQRHQLAGLYATGTEPGARRILVRNDGSLSLQELGAGPKGIASESPESYILGRYNGRPCLVVGTTGRIDVPADDTLVYFGDTYRRVR